MPTHLGDDLEVDPPLTMDANYRFGPVDRRLIDDQIREIQKQLVRALLKGKMGTYQTLDFGSVAVQPGQVVCLASTRFGTVTLVTPEAIANAKGHSGLVIVGASPGGRVFVAHQGIIPPELTLFASGSSGYARVDTSTGYLEHVSSLLDTDIAIGTIDNAGYLQLGIPFGTAFELTEGLTGGADTQLLFNNDGTEDGCASLIYNKATETATFVEPIITDPTVTDGTFDNPAVTDGTFDDPTVTDGDFTTPTIHDPTVSDGDFDGVPVFDTDYNEFVPQGSSGTNGIAFTQTNKLETTTTTADQHLAEYTIDDSYGDCFVTLTVEVGSSFIGDGVCGGKYPLAATFSRRSGTMALVSNTDFTDDTLAKGQVLTHPTLAVVDHDTIALQVTGPDVTCEWLASAHLQIVPAPTSDVLYDFDFTSLSMGFYSATSFLNRTGLTFSRSVDPGGTVQTSATTIIDGGSANQAAIGNLGSTLAKRGLVLQTNTYNWVVDTGSNNVRNFGAGTGSVWQAGSGHTESWPSDSPNQSNSGGTLVGCSSGGWGNYIDWGADNNGSQTWSVWQKKNTSDIQMGWHDAAGTAFTGWEVTTGSATTWNRYQLSRLSGNRRYYDVTDGRNLTATATGGQTARARSVYADCAQLEDGPNPTEAIVGLGGARGADLLSRATGSSFISSTGQFRFYAKFSPKHATTQHVYWRRSSSDANTATAWYLWSWGGAGTSYAKIKDSDKKLYCKVQGGTEYVSTNAISWAYNDTVEIYIAVGNNVASKAKYRINGGSWTDMVLSTVPDVPNPASGAIRLFSDDSTATGDAGSLQSWVHRVTVMDTAHYPGT